MTNKFTPGPWRVGEYDDLLQVTSDRGARNIANIEWNNGLEPVDHANAQLIAAAPEMYEALIVAQRLLLQGGHNLSAEVNDALDVIGAAISKAEGRQ